MGRGVAQKNHKFGGFWLPVHAGHGLVKAIVDVFGIVSATNGRYGR